MQSQHDFTETRRAIAENLATPAFDQIVVSRDVHKGEVVLAR